MRSRSGSSRTSTQLFGEDRDKDDVDVNEMVEGLVHSMESSQQTRKRDDVEDEYSYSPADSRLMFADEPNQLLQMAGFNNNSTTIQDARAHYRCKCFWKIFLLLCLVSSVTILAVLITKAVQRNNNASTAASSTTTTTIYYVPKPPDDISIWCSGEYMTSQGNSNACQQVCNLASCCFSTNVDTSCSTQYAEACSLYAVCADAVPTTTPNDNNNNPNTATTSTTTPVSSRQKIGPAPIDQLTSSCQPNTALDACSALCSVALCCFDPVTERNCYTYSSNHLSCNTYSKFCSILGASYGGPSVVGSDTTTTNNNPSSSESPEVSSSNNDNNENVGGIDVNPPIVGINSDTNEPTNTTSAGVVLNAPSMDLEISCSSLIEMGQESSNTIHNNRCQDACSTGSCCFAEGAADNCRENNAYVCAKYDICIFAGINSLPSNIIPSPPHSIFRRCSHAQQDSRIAHVCKQICAAAACCFDAATDACANVDKSKCSFYDACLQLEGYNAQNSTTTNIITKLRAPPEQLERDCSDYAMQGAGQDQSVNICSKTCHDGYCCFAEGTRNCRADNLNVCAMYDVCIFAGVQSMSSNSIPAAPSSISRTCSDQLIASDVGAYHECVRLCAPATCCFEGQSETCSDIDTSQCNSYQICTNLKNFILNNPPVVANQTILTEPPVELEQDCKALISKTNFEGNDNNICRSVCGAGSCCFAEGDDNCRARNQNICAKYDICIFAGIEALSSSIIPTPPVDLSSTCSEQKVVADALTYNECARICTFAACCFTSSDACTYVDKSQCSLYQACSSLALNSTGYGNLAPESNATDALPFALEDSNTAATIPDTALPPIESLANTSASFPDAVLPPTENVMLGTNTHASFPIALGLTPEGFPGSSTISTTASEQSNLPNPPDDLLSRCTGIIDEGHLNRTGCKESCAPASCCTSSINNCFEKNMNVCKLYEVCFILPDVAKTCSESVLAEPSGRAQCQELCKNKTCCFAPPPIESCKSNWVDCVPYSPCSKLNN